MEHWDCRSKFRKLRGGGKISFYQQVLSTVAKAGISFAFGSPASLSVPWLCRSHRSAALWLIRLCTLLLCAGTDCKPEFFPLVSLTGHKKMLCFLCILAFIYGVRKDDTLVSTKEMKANAIFSAGSQDSWVLTIAAEILPAKHCQLACFLQGFGGYCVMQYCKKSQYPRQQFPTSGFWGVKLKCKLYLSAQWFWFWDRKQGFGLLAWSLGNHSSNEGL